MSDTPSMAQMDNAAGTTMVNANDVSSSQVDPQLAQAILGKIAAGKPLAPEEKIAIGKLPPSLIQHAAMSGTAPMAPGTTEVDTLHPPSQMAIEQTRARAQQAAAAPVLNKYAAVAAGSRPDVGGIRTQLANVGATSPLAGGSGAPIGTSAAPTLKTGYAGNSAENQGLLPSGHYEGKAQYQGGSIVDPVRQGITPVVAPVTAPVTSKISPSVTPVVPLPKEETKEEAPTVQIAKVVKAAPDAPPSLKKMKSQDVAKMIGSILDVAGVGLSARGGVQRQTMLQHQIQLGQETTAKGRAAREQAAANVTQAQGQAAANVAQAQGEAPIEIEKVKTLLPIQTSAALNAALKEKNYDAAMEILIADKTVDAKSKVAAAAAIASVKQQYASMQALSAANNPGAGSSSAQKASQDFAKNSGS